MLETLDYTIRIGSTPTILYFDMYMSDESVVIRTPRLAEISAKRAGRLGELTIVPCKHFFLGLITRHAVIRFC